MNWHLHAIIRRMRFRTHKVYEDAFVFAFLDISPLSRGYTWWS